ncbi:MAG: hypothetical protein V2G42_06595 [bacterium JZ-2024 1]
MAYQLVGRGIITINLTPGFLVWDIYHDPTTNEVQMNSSMTDGDGIPHIFTAHFNSAFQGDLTFQDISPTFKKVTRQLTGEVYLINEYSIPDQPKRTIGTATGPNGESVTWFFEDLQTPIGILPFLLIFTGMVLATILIHCLVTLLVPCEPGTKPRRKTHIEGEAGKGVKFSGTCESECV